MLRYPCADGAHWLLPLADVFLQCLATLVMGGNSLSEPGGNSGFRVQGFKGFGHLKDQRRNLGISQRVHFSYIRAI